MEDIIDQFMTEAETQLEIKFLKSQVGGPKLTDEEMTRLNKKRVEDWEAIKKMIEDTPPVLGNSIEK